MMGKSQSCHSVLYLLLLMAVCCNISGQLTKADYYNKIDNKMFLLSKNKILPFDSIVTGVMRFYPSNEDRVRAYYTWIALNISYDSERLKQMQGMGARFMHKDSSQEANVVFNTRKAVCEGFSKLMIRFCEASGVPCQMVVGYTKTQEGEVVTDMLHAWNAVKIDSSWKLLDVTWSNGYVGLFDVYYKRFSDKYFIENADHFFTDHFPLDAQWQLSEKPVSKSYFFKTDTLNKYIAATFNYKDSVASYKKQDRNSQEWLDYVHYYHYDPQQKDYLEAADVLIYNHATDILNDGILDFQEYQLFCQRTLLKEKTKDNLKKAKAMLDSSKNKHTETLSYLKSRYAFSKI